MHIPMSDVPPVSLHLMRLAIGREVTSDALEPFLRVLYDYMSDRNLAEIGANLMGCDRGVALNRVYKAAQLKPDDPRVREARSRLEYVGLEEWMLED